MKYRFLGSQAQLKVSSLGLGCMGMSEFYGESREPSDQNAACTISRALDLGMNFLDTADEYGCGHNEELLGKIIAGRRDKIILATKCGIIRSKNNPNGKEINNHPDYIQTACDRSLKRLGIDYIDLLYLHRFDPAIPIEESFGAMSLLVEAGKVRYLGLSKVTTDVLRKAHAIHPVTAVQMEYSLWSRGAERSGMLALCKAAGIGFVAYSPLGRSFLIKNFSSIEDLSKIYSAGLLSRFREGNIEDNFKLVSLIKEVAMAKGCTPSQLALAWILGRENFIVPIPGARSVTHLEENLYAIQNIFLTPDEEVLLDDMSLLYRGDASPVC